MAAIPSMNPTEALAVLDASESFVRFRDDDNRVLVDGFLSLKECEALWVIANERLK